jgi:hypothetical protein
MTRFNSSFRGFFLCVSAALSLGAQATVVPVNLNDFFTLYEPDVAVSVDGTSATFAESNFAIFLRLSNDPSLGDPIVITPLAGHALKFQYDFAEAATGDDAF